jgi:predicted ATPase
VLQKNGSNLSSVLHSLKQGNEEKQATLVRILDLIRQLPEEPFKDFDFVDTRARDVLLGLTREDGTFTDARSLSDGTLRALAILTALETAPESSRIVIEEIDNGIHPSRIKILVDAVWECSSRRKLNILVTTHNPATLDSLNSDQLKAVVLCYLDSESHASKLMPLSELPRVESLMEQGRLGDLVTRRVVEKYLLPNFDEIHKNKARTWLESLA